MPSMKQRSERSEPQESEIHEAEQATDLIPKSGFPWIPPHILNPLILVVLNLTISTGLTALAANYVGNELSTVQTDTPEAYWWYVVPGWRILKTLGIWYGGFGVTETSLLTLLSLAPTTHFLATFHPSLSLLAHASTLSISTLSVALPIYLTRSKENEERPHHHHHHHGKHHKVERMDNTIYLTTGLLASSVYASALYVSLKTFLTRLIVTYFPAIAGSKSGVLVESVERVYHPTPVSWSLAVPVGFAVAEMVFQKAVKEPQAMTGQEVELEIKGFVKKCWDVLGPRGKVMVKRTLWVAGYMGVDTLVRLAGVMKNGSLEGGAVVSGVWAVATVLVGLVFGWIGRE